MKRLLPTEVNHMTIEIFELAKRDVCGIKG